MKKTLILLFMSILNLAVFGQIVPRFLQNVAIDVSVPTISIETDTNVYKVGYKIEVKFIINFKEDSVKYPKFDEFKVIAGPFTATSTEIINGVKTYSNTITYLLTPKKVGELDIESPIFFIKGKEVKTSKKVTILGNSLTKEEEKELRFQDFVKGYVKPNGMFRYTINDEFGYIEIYKNKKWEFYRKLTAKELETIKKIE